MNSYITGAMIKQLREQKQMTQQQLANQLNVSSKAISKWETSRGYPDISLIEPLAHALGVSIIELFAGQNITNTNKSFNMLKSKIYVCPICGNIVYSSGQSVVSCCGIVLPPLELEEDDSHHVLQIEKIEDEYYVSMRHEMTKSHSISFIMAIRNDGIEMKKLYPESSCDAYFKIRGVRYFLYYCNQHGLFKKSIK